MNFEPFSLFIRFIGLPLIISFLFLPSFNAEANTNKEQVEAFLSDIKKEDGRNLEYFGTGDLQYDETLGIFKTEADRCFDCVRSKMRSSTDNPLRGICNIVIQSEVCKDVKKEDLMNCKSWRGKGEITNPLSLLAGCTKGLFNSAKTFLKFMWDVLEWIGRTATHPIKSGKAGLNYSNSVRLYLVNEYDKAYDEASSLFPGKAVKASGATAQKVASLLVSGIVEALLAGDKKFGCYNEKARTRAICQIAGEYTIPPAAALAFLKRLKGGKKVDKEARRKEREAKRKEKETKKKVEEYLTDGKAKSKSFKRVSAIDLKNALDWGMPIKIKGKEQDVVSAIIEKTNPDFSFRASWSERGKKWTKDITADDVVDFAQSVKLAHIKIIEFEKELGWVTLSRTQRMALLKLHESKKKGLTLSEQYDLREFYNLPQVSKLRLPHPKKSLAQPDLIPKSELSNARILAKNQDGSMNISWTDKRGVQHKANIIEHYYQDLLLKNQDLFKKGVYKYDSQTLKRKQDGSYDLILTDANGFKYRKSVTNNKDDFIKRTIGEEGSTTQNLTKNKDGSYKLSWTDKKGLEHEKDFFYNQEDFIRQRMEAGVFSYTLRRIPSRGDHWYRLSWVDEKGTRHTRNVLSIVSYERRASKLKLKERRAILNSVGFTPQEVDKIMNYEPRLRLEL